jgi:hypothetical protein
MTQDLYRLAYFSRNSLLGTLVQVGAEVQQILQVSRRNNSRVGVTGALLFNHSCFAQVLEGPLSAVEETFERIQRDTRHADVTVLELAAASAREFPAWSMAFAGVLEEHRGSFASLAEANIQRAGAAAEGLYDLLRNLVLQEEGIG